MLTLVQLEDGCYKLVIDVSGKAFSLHREYTFMETESDAVPKANGDKIRLEVKLPE